MPLNYSKWDHIEISDDEDDQHPNIDTASLNKWRHEARLQRMAEAEKEKQKLQKEHTENQQKLAAMKEKLEDMNLNKDSKTVEELKELEKQEQEFHKKEEELKKKEKMTPWNVDTICQEGKSKTLINKSSSRAASKSLTDEEKMQKQQEFTKTNRDRIKKFGMFKKYEDSERYLTENPDLACEETANYLVIWCIDLAVEEKELMNHVAHQTIVMQFILELSRTLDTDPRGCIRPFFHRIKQAEKQYVDAFNDELSSFKTRVKERAAIRLEKARKELEEEEKQEREARLGPGGLDPMEVMASLPPEMQKCFELKDIGLLQEIVGKMDPKDAEYHIKRCVDSGMWVPGGGVDVTDDQKEEAGAAAAEEEPIYESAESS